MILVDTLCNELGLSHQQLADFIPTDRSLISKSQKGMRQLTPEALAGIARLGALLLAMNADAATEPKPAKVEPQWIASRLTAAKANLLQEQRRYNNLVTGNRQDGKLLRFLDRLETAGALTAKQQRWVDSRRYEISKRQQPAYAIREQELALKIHLLQQELAWLENAMQQVGAG